MELPLNPPDKSNYRLQGVEWSAMASFLSFPSLSHLCFQLSVRQTEQNDGGDLKCIELGLTFQDASRGILPLGASPRPPSAASG